MGKLVVTEFVSIDGVFEDPGGSENYEHGGWTFEYDRGDDGNQFKLDELTQADAQLLGRVTYEGFAAAWPERSDPVGFADKMNGMPKYVVSKTLRKLDWNNSTLLEGDVLDSVAKLKTEIAGDILVAGSGRLAQTLLQHGLVDELRLMVFPLVLGAGKRFFAEGGESVLRLVEAKPVGDAGVVTLTYAPA
jgi:dihydrofolate reductase